MAEKSEKALTLVTERFDKAKDFRQPREDRWNSYYKLYRNYIEDKEYPWRSKLFIPYTFSNIETVIPRIIRAIFNEFDDVDVNQPVEKLLRYARSRMDLYTKLYSALKDVLIYGTFILKPFWRYETRKRYELRPFANVFGREVGSKKTKIDATFYDDPDCAVVDPYDFYVDPRAKDIDDALFCVHRIETTQEEIKRNKANIYKNLDKLEEMNSYPGDDTVRERTDTTKDYSPRDYVDSFTKKVELLEYWENDRVITLANRQIVLRDEENPFWHLQKPFIKGVVCPVPHEFWGIGIVEMTESLQHELNDIRNMRMDNVNIIINRMWVVERSADVEMKDPMSYPSAVHVTNDINGIKMLETQDVTSNAYMEEDRVKFDMQTATGIYDYSKGLAPARKETATAVLSLQGEANKRFEGMIELLLRGAMRKLNEYNISLYQQFIPGMESQMKEFTIAGDEMPTIIKPEDIAGIYNYEMSGTPVEGLSMLARQQYMVQLYMPVLQSGVVDPITWTKELLKVYKFKDLDKIIRPPAPVASPFTPAQEGAQPAPSLQTGATEQGNIPLTMGGENI